MQKNQKKQQLKITAVKKSAVKTEITADNPVKQIISPLTEPEKQLLSVCKQIRLTVNRIPDISYKQLQQLFPTVPEPTVRTQQYKSRQPDKYYTGRKNNQYSYQTAA